jgi:type I restriction enzyme M protein
MLTGEIRGQIERLRKNLWEGGVANPLTNVEQITYLLFAKRIDEIQTLEENKAIGLRKQGYTARRIFPEGRDDIQSPGFRKDPETGEGENGCPYELMRWSRFKNEPPERMFEIVDAHLMPVPAHIGRRRERDGEPHERRAPGFRQAGTAR